MHNLYDTFCDIITNIFLFWPQKVSLNTPFEKISDPQNIAHNFLTWAFFFTKNLVPVTLKAHNFLNIT